LTLLSELPGAFGIGTDISGGALRLARANAQRLRIDRARFVACDLAAALGGPFDLIVSNPPLVATSDIAWLAPEVRDFDPRTALDGGTDGLNFYRAIAATVPMLLAAGRHTCGRTWRRPSAPGRGPVCGGRSCIACRRVPI